MSTGSVSSYVIRLLQVCNRLVVAFSNAGALELMQLDKLSEAKTGKQCDEIRPRFVHRAD